MTEEWTYAGRRIGANGKLVSAWEIPEGTVTAWPPKAGAHRVIGSVYEVQDVERADDGPTTAAVSSARFLRSGDTDPAKVREWTVADRAAYATDERRALEARAKRDSTAWDEMTLADLRAHMRKLPVGQRSAMQAWVTTYLQR